jgi:uncharacterized LabA/DUF88 family protein
VSRISFLIDGFNLYHSVVDASRDLSGASTKWLNIHSLCSSYLPDFGKTGKIESIHYFTALPYYLNDGDKIKRQRDFHKCLESTGVDVQRAKFKSKDLFCKRCNQFTKTQEEKETDIAIAAKLFELLITDSADTVAPVTGDTDLIPAANTVVSLYSRDHLRFILPYGRSNDEIKQHFPNAIDVKKERYVAHQFPDPFQVSRRRAISKPSSW